jgi:hypothetical protein
MEWITFLGYRYENGNWEIVVGGDGKHTRQLLSVIFYGKDVDSFTASGSYFFLPSVEGDLACFHSFMFDYQTLSNLQRRKTTIGKGDR